MCGASEQAAGVTGVLRRNQRDVRQHLVVGAGFAGLAAADELRRAGAEVLVLEARDRVGGRLLNHELHNGSVIESGGAFIGPTQGHIKRLAKELGVDTFKEYVEGNNIYVKQTPAGATAIPYTGTIPPDPTVLPDAGKLQGELVQGLRSLDDGFIPPIIDLSLLDRKIFVTNSDAITWTAPASTGCASARTARGIRRPGCTGSRNRAPGTRCWSSPRACGCYRLRCTSAWPPTAPRTWN